MIDSQGISISYEEDCIQERQNFTKCHELGHLVLKHNGNFFTESLANKTTQELEADYFASIILMPDIVLLTKIFYQKKSYQEVMHDLSV
ncbi:ImmA/IrrE family metallo-endopeptidase, partial [Streptococcus sanguinis]